VSQEFDVVLYGATSFVGQIMSRYLFARHGAGNTLRWAMAGRSRDKLLEVRAKLGAGGESVPLIVRSSAGLQVIDSGAPIDVLWFRVARRADDPADAGGTYYVSAGQFMVLIDRDAYWQCAYVIRKGSFPERQRHGLETFRRDVAR